MISFRNVWLRQADFVDRKNFGDFLNRSNRIGEGMEIGVHRGDFSLELLEQWQGKKLHLVDPWSNPTGYEQQSRTLSGSAGKNRDEDFECCKRNLASHANRVQYHRMMSSLMYDQIEDCSLDFVYIDGDHRYEYVLHDLRLAWSKTRRCGVIAGHDVIDHPPDGISREIQRALNEFCEEHLVNEVHLVVETLCLPWSFYLVKK